MDRIAVVGASLAGYWAVESLRRGGFDGRIDLIGAEPHLPYDRPPLSKAALVNSPPQGTTYRDADHFRSLGVDLLLGSPATGLSVADGVVHVGEHAVPFDGLIISTGASARTLPLGTGLTGVETVRTVDDAHRIARALGRTPQVVVIGAGFIGAEVAAAARTRGCEVTILEALDAPLVRACGPDMGAELGAIHGDHGVDLRTGARVASIDGEKAVESVTLADGTVLPAQLVIVGVGAAPNTAWLDGSELTVDDGVVCDATLRAAGGVYAAGDVARWTNPRYGVSMRVEHWSNAQEQGMKAAANLLAPDEATAYDAVPFFWSDQYDHVIQLAGWPADADEVEVVHRGENRALLALYRRGDQLAAALSVDQQRVLTRVRRRLGAGLGWDEGRGLVADLLAG